jgi:hypothetical protein
MPGSPFEGIPPRPRDVGEWEDLLVRFELGPRAVRLALEVGEAGPEERGSGAGAAYPLARLSGREAEAGAWLRQLREGGALQPWGADPEPVLDAEDSVARLLERYTELRRRNFGWVQRRGLEVWEWASPHPELGTVTAFQLVSYLVRHDGQRLAGIREALRAGEPC